MSRIPVAVHGAAGRMGCRVVALAQFDPEWKLVAALESVGHPSLGDDAGTVAGTRPLGVPLRSELPPDVQPAVLIDFSVPEAATAVAALCADRGIALVCATTGLDVAQAQVIHRAAEKVPVLWAPNMSLAVNLTMKLAQTAAAALRDKDADVEIIERHHRFKEDAPSGTALQFGRIIAEQMGQTSHCHGRQGRPGRRPHEQIGYHAVRAGDNPGEHTMIFAMLGETIELTVRATSRDCYAQGALAAAKFLVGKRPGMYGMADVLGLAQPSGQRNDP